jgi:hypothetical protein
MTTKSQNSLPLQILEESIKANNGSFVYVQDGLMRFGAECPDCKRETTFFAYEGPNNSLQFTAHGEMGVNNAIEGNVMRLLSLIITNWPVTPPSLALGTLGHYVLIRLSVKAESSNIINAIEACHNFLQQIDDLLSPYVVDEMDYDTVAADIIKRVRSTDVADHNLRPESAASGTEGTHNQAQSQLQMENKMPSTHFQNLNLTRIKEHLENHGYKVTVEGPDSLNAEETQAGDEVIRLIFRDEPGQKSIAATIKGQSGPQADMFHGLVHLINHVNQWDYPGTFSVDESDNSLRYSRFYTNYELRAMDLHQIMFDLYSSYSQCKELIKQLENGKSIPEILEETGEDDSAE